MIFTMIVVVIGAVLAVFFASYNQSVIEVIFFGFPVQGMIGLFLVLGLGVVLGVLIRLPGSSAKAGRSLNTAGNWLNWNSGPKGPRGNSFFRVQSH